MFRDDPRRAQARRLAVMAVAAVALATVVAASMGADEAPDDDGYPHASFTFESNGSAVVVTHYAGDTLEGASLYLESGARGRLGTFAGTDGVACATNVSRVDRGTRCRVPDAVHERLYVVWEGSENRSLLLARRYADPTPSPTPAPNVTTDAPTVTPTSTEAGPSGTDTDSQSTPTPTERPPDGSPTPTGTATPGSSPTPTEGAGTATPPDRNGTASSDTATPPPG